MAEQNAKITDEQLKEIQETKVEFNKVNDEAEEVKKKLEKEYGPINIDLSSGEYTVVEVKEEE